jgi:carboxyl-terminal processing protease
MGIRESRQRDLKKDDHGTDVEQWQKLLKDQGFDPGREDGVFNPETVAATIKFQQRHGLPGTGIVDQKTWDQMSVSKRAP